MATGSPIDNKHRMPWLVAGGAILFAVVVLVRSELNPIQRQEQEPAPAAVYTPPTPRATPMATPTPLPAPEEWATVDLPPPQPLPVQTPAPRPTASPPATPAPSPSPSPTPEPAVVALDGLVMDAEGAPIAKANIRATFAEGRAQRTLNTQSDAAGLFRLEGIRAEEIDLLLVEAVGFGRNAVEKLPLPLPDRLEIALTSLAGLNVAVQVVPDQGGKEPVPYTGDAEFVLLQKRVAAEATTQTLGLKEASIPEGTFVPVAEQRIAVADGNFRLEEVEPGEYKAALRIGNQYAEGTPVQVRQSGGRSFTTVTVGLSWPVAGKVVNETEQPVPDARVQLARRSAPALYVDLPPIAATTEKSGRFEVEKVPPGTYLATVGATGYTTTTYPLMVELDRAPAETSFTLWRKSPSIRVTVRSADGSPITDARLVLLMTDPSTKTIFAKTDQAGTYLFDRLSPGKYTLSSTAPESRSRQKSLQVDLHDGEAHDLEIAFPKTVRVLGTARRAGKPYQGLLGFNLRGSVGMETMVKTDENGGYAVDLEPGEYMVGSPEQPNAQIVLVRPDAQPRTDIEVK